MKKLLLLFGFVTSTVAFAQTTVSGKVLDQNGQPVANANIVLVGQSEGTVADFDGNFMFSSTQMPPFSVRVSSIGYSTSTVSFNGTALTVVLNEASTALDEIVISASRTPERIFESPVSVERFGARIGKQKSVYRTGNPLWCAEVWRIYAEIWPNKPLLFQRRRIFNR